MMAASEPSKRPMIEHALEYRGLGYPIFPVCSPAMGKHQHYRDGRMKDCVGDKVGKNPMTSWLACQTALPSVDQIRSWWQKWPTANIGMATGSFSGIIVLDCDSGEARQLALDRGGLERTPAVWTGKPGGTHFWMAHPGYDVANFAKDIPGTDFRGDGGYVLLPPSAHYRGATYRWAENTLGMKPAAVPPWLDELLRAKASGAASDSSDRAPLDLEEILSGIKEGERDNKLFKYACRLRHDDVLQEHAEMMIRLAARACDPAFPEDEAVAKVRNAYRNYQPAGSPTIEEEPGGGFFAPPNGRIQVAGLEDIIAPDAEEEIGWRVYNVEDFLAIEYPAVEWRVQGYLREKSILFSFGPPGSIKTFVATDAALAIASGGMFLNKFACQQGSVLIVQEDTLGSDYQQSYLRPMMKARGLTGSELRETLFVAPPAEFAFDQEDRLRDLCDWLGEHKPDLLVIDSFYLMYSGRKEDLISIMKILKRIRNKFGCAIWIIDHNRKGQADSSGENPIDRLINGREKSAAVDVVMESRPVKGEQGSTFLDVLKLRGAKLPEAVRVTYEDGLITVEGDEESTPKGAAQTVYEWLCREGGSRTKAQISRACDLSERSVHYAMGELFVAGRAKKSGKQGRADLWIAIRLADAEPQQQPSIEFDGEWNDA